MVRYHDSRWPRYVPVAERRRRAAKTVASMKKAGRDISPVQITGRKIATTFWGEAWCTNLEAYSDYANRLPRGRAYVRNGSVLDLQIEAGRVRTLVSGTDLYAVDVAIESLTEKRWTEIKGRCAGRIASLVELLQGSISKSVMEIVTRKDEGLFPSPREITLGCSCPDWAAMCKHVAATLYGVGARLDHRPALLFSLRGVDPTEMIEAAVDQPRQSGKARRGRVLETDALSSVFGVDIDMNMDGASNGEASTSVKPGGPARRGSKTRTPARPRAGRKTATKAGRRNDAAAKSTTRRSATKKKKRATKGATTGAAAKAGSRKTTAKKRAAKKATPKRKTGAKAGSRKTTAKKRAARKATPKRKTGAKKGTKKSKG